MNSQVTTRTGVGTPSSRVRPPSHRATSGLASAKIVTNVDTSTAGMRT